MASDPPVVVYDACVLYPFHLRNLLIQVAVEGLVAARWTDAIHEEWIGSLVTRRGIARERLLVTRDLMKDALPKADITRYERHVNGLSLPDPNDRHVLAAAIEAHASLIITWNLRHFPAPELTKYGIAARAPNSFLSELCRAEPETMVAVVDAARANLRRTEPSKEEHLQALEAQGLKIFASIVRQSAGRKP